MTISRRIARPLLASMFIAGGIDAVQHPDGKAKKAESVAMPLAKQLSLPEDPVQLVRINGGVQIAAGVLLAIGKLPRLAATALIGSLVPTTAAGHRFWEETDDQARAMQRIQLLKNLSMLGGLILAATDTEGRPSMSWRARHATDEVKERGRHAKDEAKERARHVKAETKLAARAAKAEVKERARHAKDDARKRAKQLVPA